MQRYKFEKKPKIYQSCPESLEEQIVLSVTPEHCNYFPK